MLKNYLNKEKLSLKREIEKNNKCVGLLLIVKEENFKKKKLQIDLKPPKKTAF